MRCLIQSVLSGRGLISKLTNNLPIEVLASNVNISAYCGFDPTASSLHIGHLLPIVVLRHMQKAGIRPILLIGGATGMIGDPSGKSQERNLLSHDLVNKNTSSLHHDLKNILDFECPQYGAKIVNNMDWHGKMTCVDWLRDAGRYFRISNMLSKDSVKSRLETDSGLSFLEFSYQIFQAYDFFHLYKTENCLIQIGGNDQWGNIVSGSQLIRKKLDKQVFGLTVPLLMNGNGQKLGKSERNALSLNSELTSEYEFYQHFLRTADSQVENMLKLLTLLPLDEIQELMKNHRLDPEKRLAQQKLAEEITKWVHGEKGLSIAKKSSSFLFGGDILNASAKDINAILMHTPYKTLPKMEVYGKTIIEISLAAGIFKSKGECKRLVNGGGFYLKNSKVQDVNYKVSINDAIEDNFLIFRSGNLFRL